MPTRVIRLCTIAFCSLSFFFLCGFSPFIQVPEGFTACETKENAGVVSSYMEKKSMKFSPSIVLFVETLKESKADYEKRVKKHFNSLQDTQVTYLPSLSTPYGKALILQIDKKHQVGDLRLLQLILVHEKTSYIVTCCVLKKDFPSYQKKFLETLHSLRLS